MKKMQPNCYRYPSEHIASFMATKGSLEILSLVLLMLFSLGRISAQTVFTNEYSGVIHTMDMRDCELTYRCTSLMFGDIAWQAGNLYGIQGLSLYTIDLSTGSATPVGTASSGISMPGMVGDGAGNLYLGDYSGNLQKFSIANGTFTVVGNAGNTCSGDLAKIGDTIYMIGAGLTLVKITLNPFSSTVIGTMNFGGTSPKAYGMVPSAWSDTLIVSVSYTGVNKLFKVNTNNASATIFCDSLTAVPTMLFGMATDAEDAYNAVREVSAPNLWRLYPNPASDLLKITSPGHNAIDCNLQVMNINGTSILNRSARFSGSYVMDVSNLPSGVYNLMIRSSKETKHLRFVITR